MERVVRKRHNDRFIPIDSEGLNSWDDVMDRFGNQEVSLHRHAQESKRLGQNVFSVVTDAPHEQTGKMGFRSVAHVLGGNLVDPYVNIDRGQLEQSYNKPAPFNKTRNTFLVGMPSEHPVVGESSPVELRRGLLRVGDRTLLQVHTEEGMVRKRKSVGGGKQKMSEPEPGIVVPPQQLRTEIFARGAIVGRHGITAIDPLV